MKRGEEREGNNSSEPPFLFNIALLSRVNPIPKARERVRTVGKLHRVLRSQNLRRLTCSELAALQGKNMLLAETLPIRHRNPGSGIR